MDDPTIISVNGKKYRIKKEKGKRIDGILHGDKIVAVPFNEKEHKERIDYIVRKIEYSVKLQEILKEILNSMTDDELEKIEKLLKKGAKIKRSHGCLGLKIGGKGGAYIDLVG